MEYCVLLDGFVEPSVRLVCSFVGTQKTVFCRGGL